LPLLMFPDASETTSNSWIQTRKARISSWLNAVPICTWLYAFQYYGGDTNTLAPVSGEIINADNCHVLFYRSIGQDKYQIYSEGTTGCQQWGNWDGQNYCNPSKFSYGILHKYDPGVGSKDQTGTTGVTLYCTDDAAISSGEITAWGQPGKRYNCADNKTSLLTGIALWVEGQYRGAHGHANCHDGTQLVIDDYSVGGFQVACRDNKWNVTGQYVSELYNTNYGDTQYCGAPIWQNWLECAPGFYVCGIQTRVEPPQGNGHYDDNTALNNVALYCCMNNDFLTSYRQISPLNLRSPSDPICSTLSSSSKSEL